MKPEIQLILFSAILSSAIAYAWWVKFRVWMFREDLFAIRDRVWDTMQELGQLDDQEHRRLRAQINSLIRIAPLFSVWTVFSIMLEGVKFDLIEKRCAPDCVQKAQTEVVQKVTRYLLLNTLSGLLVFGLIVVAFVVLVRVGHPLRRSIDRFAAWTNQIVGSLQIREESSQIETFASGALTSI
jgi:Fe2+ transport system protein B